MVVPVVVVDVKAGLATTVDNLDISQETAHRNVAAIMMAAVAAAAAVAATDVVLMTIGLGNAQTVGIASAI